MISYAGAGRAESKAREFERECLPHLDALYRYARSLTKEASEAEDLVQEAMLRAYRGWDSYETGTNARAWLFTILRNTNVSRYRRNRRLRRVDFHEVEGHSLFDEVQEEDPEGRFFDQLVSEDVIRALQRLPDKYREVVLLSDVEGLRYAELAEIFDVAVGTVKSRLFRGRQQLQKELYRYAQEMGYISRRSGNGG